LKDEQFYLDKLLKLPVQFTQAYYEKKFARAKYIYDTACRVVEFMEPPEHIKKLLFGDWDDTESEISEGLFQRDMVSKAYEECVIKSYQSFEYESYRRFGQSPQYYPVPRYPVPGYPKPK